ncbi:MAG: hypothetical protein LPK80_08610 [Bacteroidota bacterium]|nr:hypothetical protein [Bacteroidota bacterium]
MKLPGIFLISMTAFLVGCTQDPLEVDVSDVDYSLNIHRFDKALIGRDTSDFARSTYPELRDEFMPFMSTGTIEFWKNQASSAEMARLQKEIDERFPDLEKLQSDLENALQHYYYYYPQASRIEVYAYNSGLDLNFPVLFADSILFIALDNYLGPDHPAYGYLDRYLVQEKSPEYITRDAMLQIGQTKVRRDQEDQTLLADMIHWGRIWYFTKAMMPDAPDSIITGFSSKELTFSVQNERSMWSYFLDNNLLYDTGMDAKRRFINLAPFSKFYLQFDSETPGMAGRWIGYRIVSDFMENSETTLPELMRMTDARRIFVESRYKP